MPVDAASLLHELDVRATAGSTSQDWLLRAPDGTSFEVRPTSASEHLSTHLLRSRVQGHPRAGQRALLIARTATDGVLRRAQAGEIDLLTETPLRLIHDGHAYEAAPAPAPLTPPRLNGRPAWVRWALARYLLTAREPRRQSVIAQALGSSQQAVSHAARALGELVADNGAGLVVADPVRLLEQWVREYPGPRGQRFGWYALDPAAELAEHVVALTAQLELTALVSGDVAADQLAPWKLPASALVYVSGPIDLAGDGFVPTPLEEANVVTCVPDDPTVWTLASALDVEDDEATLPLADPALVYWDLLMSGTQDSAEAADHLAAALFPGAR